MTRAEITDPDVKLLASIATELEPGFEPDRDDWLDSPFQWIKGGLASRTKGTVGEQIVEEWCLRKGFQVSPAPSTDCDRVIGGLRTEIKLSTRWKQGNYKFQQIRDQDYDVLICLGLSPFDASCWVFPKAELWKRPPGVSGQHGGARGTDTLWLNVNVERPHPWMSAWGGTLADAHMVLRRLAASVV